MEKLFAILRNYKQTQAEDVQPTPIASTPKPELKPFFPTPSSLKPTPFAQKFDKDFGFIAKPSRYATAMFEVPINFFDALVQRMEILKGNLGKTKGVTDLNKTLRELKNIYYVLQGQYDKQTGQPGDIKYVPRDERMFK